MAVRLAITEAELLDALAAARPTATESDAQTVEEMRSTLHVSEKTVRRALAEMKRQGRLRVHRVYREGLDGRNCFVSAYTILPRTPRG